MRKIIEQSGPGSNEGAVLLVEGPHSSDICDDGTHAKEICFQLDRTFLQDFRTLNGYCNNKENPVLGSKGSRLSRLLPAEHMKVEKPTYFEKPQLNGMFNYFMVMDFIYRYSEQNVLIIKTLDIIYFLQLASTLIVRIPARKNQRRCLSLEKLASLFLKIRMNGMEI